ncbi:MAG: cytidine deaminase [Pseudomonadota bacterium]|jgi:cytidine deaminase|uniref:Cytidine deaminase n=1 Tax=Qipengyuania pacifica TaxID=2860199 RepID=A0ABS7JCX7_9SPHN|nr:cytidine deaminase [Qipengyuania aerophila]MAP68328.1 cytidine deaminase [Erythrobacteraceae bacterium]MCH2498285.1 cytidine deaminase [Erythrobacter sp.]MEC7889360.1 cytidine deaminase [Pseudomonadota bacterium]QPL40946.1 cytidine deaminase [Erythrobacter sp. A30-3]MBX7487887.1 cytidine deaminase [Qipengyuania aerophila]|tara:strand:- start:884 stop:1288 length:405 start_codon:yes stop_codon:yes gene_type:complete
MTDQELIDAARQAAQHSYSPYSKFPVGAALRFADGSIVTGTNIENASYGLALCAETVAVSKAMADGARGGLEAVAVTGPGTDPITPCGRCRQVLNELAQLGGTDPEILCVGPDEVRRLRLSDLLPHAFGPASLA